MLEKLFLLKMKESIEKNKLQLKDGELEQVIEFAYLNGIRLEDIVAFYMSSRNSLMEMIIEHGKLSEQQAKVRGGLKIAYKEDASVEKVEQLLSEGYSTWKIANKLGVSEATIKRRIRALKQNGKN